MDVVKKVSWFSIDFELIFMHFYVFVNGKDSFKGAWILKPTIDVANWRTIITWLQIYSGQSNNQFSFIKWQWEKSGYASTDTVATETYYITEFTFWKMMNDIEDDDDLGRVISTIMSIFK